MVDKVIHQHSILEVWSKLRPKKNPCNIMLAINSVHNSQLLYCLDHLDMKLHVLGNMKPPTCQF